MWWHNLRPRGNWGNRYWGNPKISLSNCVARFKSKADQFVSLPTCLSFLSRNYASYYTESIMGQVTYPIILTVLKHSFLKHLQVPHNLNNFGSYCSFIFIPIKRTVLKN